MLTVQKSILDASETYILQQVNCRGTGLAKAISDKWPVVKEEYLALCSMLPEHSLLGMVQPVHVAPNKFVLNIFVQSNFGRDRIYTDYDVLFKAFENIPKVYTGTFAIPYKIGDWNLVLPVIERCFGDKAVIYCNKT